MEFLILTSIVVILFIAFGIAVFKEFKVMDKTEYKYTKEVGPRAGLVNFIGDLVSNDDLSKKEKEVIFKVMNRNIADMESDGVYIDDNIKEVLMQQRQNLSDDQQNI